MKHQRRVGALVLALGLAACTAACMGSGSRVVSAEGARPFGPKPPAPAGSRDDWSWQSRAFAAGRYAVYEDVVWRGEGALRFSDATAYFWDGSTRELVMVSPHADPGVGAEIVADGSAVIFAEQRDPQTRRDGVNPDPWVKRVARWDRGSGSVTGLTAFRFGTIVDIALSGDGSTVAFLGDRQAFVGPAKGGTRRTTSPIRRSHARAATGTRAVPATSR